MTVCDCWQIVIKEPLQRMWWHVWGSTALVVMGGCAGGVLLTHTLQSRVGVN